MQLSIIQFKQYNYNCQSSPLLHHIIIELPGLNVYSMLKHETVVMTMSALEAIEEKLVYQINKTKYKEQKFSL